MFAQEFDGELLLKTLDKIEVLGPNKYTNGRLRAATVKYPTMAEYDAAIKSALFNWTT